MQSGSAGGLLVPSIKATGFQSAADDLGKLLESGRISRAEVEKRLRPADLPFLGKQLAASSWVPIETYVRVLDILIDCEAKGQVEEYLRERGRRAGARMHKMGIYSQFNASVETYGERVGTISTTMTAVLYNFSRWSYVPVEPYEFQLVVDDAEPYPEYLRFVAEGFTEYLGEHLPGAGRRKVTITSERVRHDKIVFKGKLG